MSALLCGCDREAHHICAHHLEEAQMMQNVAMPYSAPKMAAAEAFESEAVRIAQRTAAKFQERLAAERTMADTVAVKSDDELSILTSQIRALNALVQKEQRDNERLIQECKELHDMKGRNALLESMLSRGETKLSEENALLRRSLSVLNTRIEELEHSRDMYQDNIAVINRIAIVLRNFYYAELSLSSVQPIIALAMELNPEIVEKLR